MLRAVLSGLFMLAAACAQERDFDTRYEEAEQEIEAKAEAIDSELAPGGEKQAAPQPEAR